MAYREGGHASSSPWAPHLAPPPSNPLALDLDGGQPSSHDHYKSIELWSTPPGGGLTPPGGGVWEGNHEPLTKSGLGVLAFALLREALDDIV